MRILLAENAVYVPSHGGANKANRMLIEGLAARGHACRVVARATSVQGARSGPEFLAALAARGMAVTRASAAAVVFEHRGVEVHAVNDPATLRAYLTAQIQEFAPTWTIVASEDPGQVLLEASLPRAVYFAQTTLLLPFGPGAFINLPARVEPIRRAAGVITVSRYLHDYLRRWGGIDSVIIHAPIYGPGPFPCSHSFDSGYVTMINPCAVKGITLFAGLAERLPETAFAAVTSWGTTAADRQTLERLPNVTLLDPVDDIDDVLSQARVVLVPSLWAEAYGCVAVEAMLRGIPVLASDVGGLPEAKLGVDYVLPVRPIERYTARLDDRLSPVPVVPPQDVEPWLRALREVLSDRERYERLAADSRAAALAAVAKAGIEPFEAFLENLG